MKSPGRRFQVRCEGVSSTVLARQSLQNHVTNDRGQTIFAHFRCAGAGLKGNVLERVTWALLGWSEISTLYLHDERLDVVVAEVVRDGRDLCSDAAGSCYVWRSDWVTGDESTPLYSAGARAAKPFPPTRGRSGWLGRHFGFGSVANLHESAVAERERLKQIVQRLAGAGFARFLHRQYQLVGDMCRGRRKATSDLCVEAVDELSAAMLSSPEDGMGILFMVPRVSPGGAEKSVIDLAGGLASRGHRVHMMTTFGSRNTWADRVRDAGVALVELPAFLPESCWLAYLQVYLSGKSIDLLHVMNSHWAYAHLPEIRRRTPQLRIVDQLHAEGVPGSLDFPTLASRADACVDRHTVISDHLARYLSERLGVAPERIQRVRTGIDLCKELDGSRVVEGAWRAQRGVDGDTRLVIFVGRFSELKRPMRFLEIAEQVLESFPHTLFVMKGEGPLEGLLRRRIRRSPALRRRVIMENASGPVAQLMCDADVLLLPSAMEGIAYVSYEAMAHGLPQVFADVGAQSELLDGESGIAVAPGENELRRYVEAVEVLLADDRKRERMGQAACSRLIAWPSAGQMTNEYEALYAKLLGK